MIKRCNGSLIAQGLLNNKECELTIDTGATRSIVRPDLITSTPMQKLRQTPILETANGDRIAHLEKETDLGLVIVEPLEHEMEDLPTARCLVDSSDASHTIPVRVANLKDNRITLKQGKVIGNCTCGTLQRGCSKDSITSSYYRGTVNLQEDLDASEPTSNGNGC